MTPTDSQAASLPPRHARFPNHPDGEEKSPQSPQMGKKIAQFSPHLVPHLHGNRETP
jgi:hypothetical protein